MGPAHLESPMTLSRRRFLSASGMTLLATAVPRPALAETYPAKPVRVIVPFAAGGPNDLAARLIAQGLSDRLGKQFYVENIGSAGKFSYASPGAGTPPHLLGELFRLSFGLDLVHVPFNSGGAAIGSTVAGHTPVSFGALPPAVQHVKEGKLRALAITSSVGSQ